MMRFFLLNLLIVVLFMNCQPTESRTELRSGDILFRGKMNGSLSKAIDEVTQTGQEHHYTHMGIVELTNDTVWVLHAAPEKGVYCELLSDFCLQGEDSVIIGHYRIKNITEVTIKDALTKAHTHLGEAYNYSYIMEDNGYYCSEFVYEIFASDSVFELNPMTFINPATGDFHTGWVEHYQKIGIEIPEGKPGCNPNGMAASERLLFLGEINN